MHEPRSTVTISDPRGLEADLDVFVDVTEGEHSICLGRKVDVSAEQAEALIEELRSCIDFIRLVEQ